MLRFAILALALPLAALDAGAAVLYKLTDRLGHVTYSDSVPRLFDGEVARMDIDTAASVVASDDLPQVIAATSPPPLVVPGPSYEDRVDAAQASVDAARAALANAQNNSTAEDWIYFGPDNPVGMRRAPRPAYRERLARLEAEVAAAEERLIAVERDRP